MIRRLFRRSRNLYMQFAFVRLYRKVETVSRVLRKHDKAALKEFQHIVKQFDKTLQYTNRLEAKLDARGNISGEVTDVAVDQGA
jgi:hypothetical protein